MLKLGVSEKYLQIILGSSILILILVLGLFGNTDTVLKYIFSSTCPSLTLTSNYPGYDPGVLLVIMMHLLQAKN